MNQSKRKHLLAAKPEPRSICEAPPKVEPIRQGNLTVRVAIDGLGLVVLTPNGREITLAPNMQGLGMLVALAKSAAGLEREERHPATAKGFSPLDYQRVCHCGKIVQPFMERCKDEEGNSVCPGHEGAGFIPKLRNFDERGREKLPQMDELLNL